MLRRPGCAPEYHATQALLKSIAGGDAADVVILTAEGIDQLTGRRRAPAADAARPRPLGRRSRPLRRARRGPDRLLA